jgi:DNA adenine methylase
MQHAILKYPGAKWRLTSWLQTYTPRCLRVVDAYCGSGAFALGLSYRPSHLVLNDQDRYLVRFFQALRERCDTLAAAVALTPWSRAEYLAASGPAGDIVETGDLVEDARRFLIVTWQAHGTTLCTRNGWRHKGRAGSTSKLSGTYELWNALPERLLLAAAALKDAEIECLPALAIIGRYATPETLIYADPPYVRRSDQGARKKLYRHEMTDDDHRALLAALEAHPGPVMLSGYDNDLYRELIGHWRRVEVKAQAEKGNTRYESLWLNEACVALLPQFQEAEQLALEEA